MSDLGDVVIVRLDKEAGITSHDAVDRLRRVVGTRRVGHAGTLDPFATGLLLLAWGRATRLLPFLAGTSKTYRGTLELGLVTDTLDGTGRVLERRDVTLDENALREAARTFVGAIEQRVPAVSAIKQGGEALHRRVRRGEAVDPPIRRVTIESLTVDSIDTATKRASFTVTCSSGTYVRSLAADWGNALGTGATLVTLRRLAIGPHSVEGAIPTSDLLERPIGSIPEWNERLAVAGLTADGALAFLPALRLRDDEANALALGRAPARSRALDAGLSVGLGAFRFTSPDGRLLGVGSLADATASADAPIELRLVWAAASGAPHPAETAAATEGP
jgi:tRNA pseudouridine55 synthase